jgi:uncharacterized membrane protein
VGEQVRRRAGAARADAGSVLLLTIGYAILAIAVVLVGVDATSLYLAQRRLDGIADAAALAGADGFTLALVDGQPAASLSASEVHEQAMSFLRDSDALARLVAADSPDGRSARVTVEDTWHPPVSVPLILDHVTIRSTSTARTAVR